MGAYIVRRVFIGIVLLLVMSFVTFALFFASPVNPARFICGKNCTPELRQQASKALGYDKPWPVQWAQFVEGIVVGREYPNDPALAKTHPELITHCPAPCFGYSFFNGKTVNSEIAKAAPVTASIATLAVILWMFGGVLFGILAAIKRGTLVDRSVVGATLVIYAFPSFFIGKVLLVYVAITWHLWPIPDYTPISQGGVFLWLENIFLPAVSLALISMAAYVRITRAFVLESLEEDYIRTARAKGLKSRVVLFKHALRAALTPLVTLVGLDFATLLGGAIITENVFNMPGLGQLAVQANNSFDLPTLIGLLLLAGGFVILANIIVDVLYAVIDPRVRVG